MNSPKPAVLAVAVLLILAGCSSPASSPGPRLDAAKVPEDIRALVPLAERWGIGDDVDRAQLVDSATQTEKDALRSEVAPHAQQINAWLDTFKEGAMTDEAAAFMYMLLALDEMGGP